MITKVVVTWDFDDSTTKTFDGTPEVVAVPAQGVDLSTIPTEKPQ
jgi:hypothetical protein